MQLLKWVLQPLFLAFLSFSGLSHGDFGNIHHVPYEEDGFDWNSIQPSAHLVYHKCFHGLECARLEVPLDWSNSSNQNKIVLAIGRLPARVKSTDPAFGGTIVTNPGGPGGSGIDLLRTNGRGMQAIVDNEKHFEILSFDPRGVKFTTPSTACFGDDLSRQIDNLKSATIGTIDLSDEAFNLRWAAAAGFTALCEKSRIGVYPDGSNIRQYVSTALVARDMIAIIDRVDEHLQKELQEGRERVPQRPMVKSSISTPPRLNYWGFSYGTYLGNTFASLYPSRIGRMSLDAVVDAPDYAAAGWTTNLQDTHKTLESILTDCFAGGHVCPLYNEGMTSAQDIHRKLASFMTDLADNPIPIIHDGGVELITLHDVREQIFQYLYHPMQYYPYLGQMLADLIAGNATLLIPYLPSIKLSRSTLFPLSPQIPAPVKPFQPNYAHGRETTTAILCGDGTPINKLNKSDYRAYLSLLQSQSPSSAGHWADIKLPCPHWPDSLRPSAENSFSGPFATNLFSYSPGASPLLFLGNTADPVTPLRNAWKMSRSHEGSRVLVLDAPGHCTGPDKPSACVAAALKRFFAAGELPKSGTVCEVERRPWDGMGPLGARE